MTDAEWDACADPYPMLDALERHGHHRKLRLFVVGCYRLAWDRLNQEDRDAAETAERDADGQAEPDELKEAYCAAHLPSAAAHEDPEEVEEGAENDAESPFDDAWATAGYLSNKDPALAPLQAELLRDIFAPPSGLPHLEASWRTPEVRGLAQSIYEEWAFDRLSILADALEDAGCTEVAILSHCREKKVHGRGCWLLDLILDKD